MPNPPRTGGYFCVDGGAGFDLAIKLFTHSDYTHCGVILDADTGEILETKSAGSRLANLSEYSGHKLIYSQDSILDYNRTVGKPQLYKMAEAHFLGIPYGFLDIVYLGLLLSRLPDPGWLWKKVLSEDRMICSQLVATFGAQYGANWNCGHAYSQLVTPGNLAHRIVG